MDDLQVWLSLLLLIDLLGLTSDQKDVLALPETIRRVRDSPATLTNRENPLFSFSLLSQESLQMARQIDLSRLFMPDLDLITADAYASVFETLRLTLLVAWCAFLAMPYAWTICSTACYICGAVAYTCMFSLAQMFEPSNDCHCTCFFLLAACLCVPGLEKPHVKAWLGKFLLVSVLAPFYLSAGLEKLRYAGWSSVLTGHWVVLALLRQPERSYTPGFVQWVVRDTWLAALMSLGTLLVEFALPLAVLSLAGSTSAKMRTITIGWGGLTIAFHIMSFFIVGANFSHQTLLAAVLIWCTWHAHAVSDGEALQPCLTWLWTCRIAFGTVLLVSFFLVQLYSDIAHVSGLIPQLHGYVVGWPMPGMTMFVAPSADSNYVRALFLELAVLAYLSIRWISDMSKAKPV